MIMYFILLSMHSLLAYRGTIDLGVLRLYETVGGGCSFITDHLTQNNHQETILLAILFGQSLKSIFR